MMWTSGTRVGSLGVRWTGGSSGSLHHSGIKYAVEWGIEDQTPPFRVSPTGDIFLTSIMDAEKARQQIFVVTASTSSQPTHSTMTRVTVLVRTEFFSFYSSCQYNKCTLNKSNLVNMIMHVLLRSKTITQFFYMRTVKKNTQILKKY